MQELSRGQYNYFKDSKIRDENGDLLTVYIPIKNKSETVLYQLNTYTDPDYIKDKEGFSKAPMYVNAKNPFRYDSVSELHKIAEENGCKTIGDILDCLKEQGYDAIVGKNKSGVQEITAFEPNQLKSVKNRFPTKEDYPLDNSEDYRRVNFRNMTVEEHFELAKLMKEKHNRVVGGKKEIDRDAQEHER